MRHIAIGATLHLYMYEVENKGPDAIGRGAYIYLQRPRQERKAAHPT